MATRIAATTYRNFIDGDWVGSASGQTFDNRNPADTGDLIGLFQQSNGADAKAAIGAAARAYEHWRLVPAPLRAEILFKAAQIIAARKEDFARDMTREMGKVLSETRGDVQEAIDMTFYMAGEGRRLFGQTVPSELRNKFAMSVRQPVGVASIITPWNFPMAIPSWKIVPALVCGNTVVFKPSSQTPLSALVVGDGLTPETQVGPSNSEAQLRTVMKYVKIGQEEGATLATGGHRLETGAYAKGYFHEPTVFVDVDPAMRIAREEIFGPVVSVMPCASLDEAIAIGNGVEYGLSASVYTQDINRAFQAMRDLYTGIFYVNAPTIGAEVHLPFGGTKNTGNGHREAGIAALEVFSEWKSIYIDFSGKLQRAQIDTE